LFDWTDIEDFSPLNDQGNNLHKGPIKFFITKPPRLNPTFGGFAPQNSTGQAGQAKLKAPWAIKL